ncbi:hypothetical protein Kisp01_50030 [Kineosporia sp. NBRC 101677]|nr:hypothetical protein [Kineosporia sp. NBRC 101677]GLY17989.1 hypothetical protein Kisp01_50030 [Kineosporia sp. NBRC 101677]
MGPQQVKAYLALHNVYGVDLNATAIELAEITIWLATMVPGLPAPWFGLHLRRGNSLIGARRAAFHAEDLTKKAWLSAVPEDLPLSGLASELDSGQVGTQAGGVIHHFLLPTEGWGSAVDAKEAKPLAGQAQQALLQEWRRSVLVAPSQQQTRDLLALGRRVEQLWAFALQRLRIAEREIRRDIEVWGASLPAGGDIQRADIEAALHDPDGAYGRLRRVMDAWTALWFWPLTERELAVDGGVGQARPPSLSEWISALQALLGIGLMDHSQPTLATGTVAWADLGLAERIDLELAGAQPIEDVLTRYPWLQICERVSRNSAFFHWDLDFAPVMARGGFDLQVGNPPWVRPRSDVDALLSEGDPWFKLAVKPTQTQIAAKRETTLTLPDLRDQVIEGTVESACVAAFVASPAQYVFSAGLQPDLYRCFMQQTWRHVSARGLVGLIHPETHFTDEKAAVLRTETYKRLRRHWQFINALFLFEIHDQVVYGVHVYGANRGIVDFRMAAGLYHPDTVTRSENHDGSGDEPGLKDPDGNWDQRPHGKRILRVNADTLKTWHELLEDETVPVEASRMVYTVSAAPASVLAKLSKRPRIAGLGLRFSRGWDESIDRKKGRFDSEWGSPSSWDDVILQGPHLFVNTPMYKNPNKSMKHNQDWSATDLETLPADATPVTAYKPRGSRDEYDAAYTDWGTPEKPNPARDHYRIAWRCMAANTGERTLIPALVPPGCAHVDGVVTACAPQATATELLIIAASLGSLVLDSVVRVVPKSTIRASAVNRLPSLAAGATDQHFALRMLRLNAITVAYSDLWGEAFNLHMKKQYWVGGMAYPGRNPLGEVDAEWSQASPLRRACDRRQAQTEIDVLVALSLGLTADELCTIYRTQFPVLYGYDRNTYFYDANGRRVPNSVLTVWRKKGNRISEVERAATNQAGNTYTYELPFITLDREADMRKAYEVFADELDVRVP